MELNHLKTFENYTNEEFNPFKGEDWNKAGHSLRRGIGLLTPEELKQKGKEMLKGNNNKAAKYRERYNIWLKKDPEAAEKFIVFIAEHPDAIYYDYVDNHWVETGIGNWGEGTGRLRSR